MGTWLRGRRYLEVVIACVAVVAIVAACLYSARMGNGLVALGTLTLAGATFISIRGEAERRRFEREPNIALKDSTLTSDGGSPRLTLQLIANLGLHPLLLRYVSADNEAGRRRRTNGSHPKG